MKCVKMALLACLFSGACFAAPHQNISKSNPSDQNSLNSVKIGNVIAGKEKSEDNRCQECHGPDGNGQGPSTGAAGKFAKLAGQYPDYITKQISEFRSGERKHDLMHIMAKSIDDGDAVDIAAYFTSQKKMHGDGSGKTEVAQKLFTQGDTNRNILPCINCHGIDGKGLDITGQVIPIIGGQEWQYLEKQLQDWRSGERHNSAGNVMNTIAKPLTDAEIKALTDYISGL